MTHTDLLKAIFTKVSGIVGLPAIVYPNTNLTPTGDYVSIYVLPAETIQETLYDCTYKFGLIQLNIVIADKVGEIKASTYADLILTALKNNMVISGGLKVSKPPYASIGMNDASGHYTMPVTVPYKIYDLE